jgi:hypothetical protein
MRNSVPEVSNAGEASHVQAHGCVCERQQRMVRLKL